MENEVLITRVVGDKLTPISALLLNGNNDPVSLSGKTVTFSMADEVGTTTVVAETSSHITKEPAQTVTFTANVVWIRCVGHGLRTGQQVIFATDGTLPANITAGTRYTVRDTQPNVFQVMDYDKLAIAPASAGTGNHTVAAVGFVQYAPQTADVATAGDYFACFKVSDGTNKDTYPGNEKRLRVRLEERP